MFAKIVFVAALLAVAYAQHHSQEHGQAYSSQSFVLHQEEAKQAPSHQVEYHATPVYHSAPVYHVEPAHHAPTQHEEQEEHYYVHPKYEYLYNVEDKHTGDIKSAQESHEGDVVKGEYSLHQPDGRVRTVKYTADKHSGYNAEVTYSGEAQAHQEQPQLHYHH